MNRKAELEKEIKQEKRNYANLRMEYTQNAYTPPKEETALHHHRIMIIEAELKGIVDTENRIKEEIEKLRHESQVRCNESTGGEFNRQTGIICACNVLKRRLFGGKDND